MLKKAKTDKAERLKCINRLFRTNPKVSEMRKKYGVDSFYNYSMHTLLFFLLGFCSFQYFSNLNRSSNTMPKLVDRKLSGCASFAAVNLRKSETFFAMDSPGQQRRARSGHITGISLVYLTFRLNTGGSIEI